MFSGFFREATRFEEHGAKQRLPVTPLTVQPHVAPLVLKFLYCDRVDIPLESALDTLYAADLLLLERLKALSCIVITTKMTDAQNATFNIYDVLRAAWHTRSERLEQFVSQYFAQHLEQVIVQSEFAEIVVEVSVGRLILL